MTKALPTLPISFIRRVAWLLGQGRWCRLVRTGITATANMRNPRTNVGGRVDGNSVHLSSLRLSTAVCCLILAREIPRISDSAIFVIEELRRNSC